MKVLKRLVTVIVAVLFVAIIAAEIALNVRPGIDEYAPLRIPGPSDPAAPDTGLRATFLGVSTLLFDDGETAIMTDGFFSRPGLFRVATRIAPDSGRITDALLRAGVDSLAAVIAVHSHYDHVMDAPLVARLTRARLVGSTSTRNVGLGAGLPDSAIDVPPPGVARSFGRFRVTLLASRHVPSPVLMPGEITSPLTPPARTRDYRLGDCYTVLIEHDGLRMLVQGSAGFIPGALRGVKADVVFLGIATLGKQDPEYQADLWREVVLAVGAKRVIVIHWDDFLRPLSLPLVPMPRLMDDFTGTMRFLLRRGADDHVDVRIPVEWAPMSPA